MSQRTFYDLFPITSLVALLVVGFFVLEVVANQKLGGELQQGLFSLAAGFHPKVYDVLGAMDPHAVLDREYWRLVSCLFLHGGLLHLVFNTAVLVDLGRICEPLLSGPKFFTIYVASGIGSSLLSLANSLWGFGRGHGSVGASGALCGLVGLMLVFAVKGRHTEMRDALIRWVIFIAVIGLLFPGIDNAGHLGGFLTGGALGFTVRDYTTSRAAARWLYPAYLTGAVVAASLGMALWNLFAAIL